MRLGFTSAFASMSVSSLPHIHMSTSRLIDSTIRTWQRRYQSGSQQMNFLIDIDADVLRSVKTITPNTRLTYPHGCRNGSQNDNQPEMNMNLSSLQFRIRVTRQPVWSKASSKCSWVKLQMRVQRPVPVAPPPRTGPLPLAPPRPLAPVVMRRLRLQCFPRPSKNPLHSHFNCSTPPCLRETWFNELIQLNED